MVGTKGRGPKPTVDWGNVDWSVPDTELGEQLGVTRSRVNQVRKKVGRPPAGKPGWGSKHQAQRQRVEAALAQRPLTRSEAIAQECGVCTNTVRAARRRLGLPKLSSVSRHSPLHDRLNWALPNCDLDRIWGLTSGYASTFRNRRKIGPARWHCKGGRVPQDPEYHQAIEREEEKAREFKRGG